MSSKAPETKGKDTINEEMERKVERDRSERAEKKRER
jgi:hypothetical protein